MNRQRPLDMEEGIRVDTTARKRLSFYLEMIPLLLICGGFLLKYLGSDYWQELLGIGGILAVVLYLFFSWYLFRVEEYKGPELVLSVASGLVFPLGILGIIFRFFYWDGAYELLQGALYGGLTLSAITILLFLFHLRDERASRFYRKLLARLMIFTVILLTVLPGFL